MFDIGHRTKIVTESVDIGVRFSSFFVIFIPDSILRRGGTTYFANSAYKPLGD